MHSVCAEGVRLNLADVHVIVAILHLPVASQRFGLSPSHAVRDTPNGDSSCLLARRC